MKRRKFLQGIGSILAALGVTEAGWLQLGNSYQQALAMPTNRKLALLVGVNQYNQSPALAGCLTDVELQRELLIHRFGFQPSDILPLTEQQATRQVIETAFNEHLVKQARPGDVVFFHFSGYGSRVQLAKSLEKAQNALVTIDDSFSTQNGKNVNLILEETLRLLLRSLPTKYVTAVLDTSFNAGNIRPSGLRIRNYPQVFPATMLDAELDFQKQLSQINKDLPGFLLTATSGEEQLAMEGLFSGFSAGLFTYALTQQLWEATPATTIQFSLSQAASTILTFGGQQQPELLNDQLADHFLPNRETAVGAITEVEGDGKTAQVWLGGLPPQVLEYGMNSRFVLVTDNTAKIVLRSRSGLSAKAQIDSVDKSLQAGQLVRESIRVLPRSVNLSVALDSRLERIERVDAISAFATVTHASSVIEGEQPADCIFGRKATKTSESASPTRYGLFSVGHELIKNTVGEPGEAVKVAVHRLAPDLQKLLAVKLWRLTVNEGSSLLAVKATLEIASSTPEPLIQRQTLGIQGILSSSTSRNPSGNVPTLPIGTRIQYRVQNQSDRPIYLMLLGLDSNRKAIALYPGRPMEETNTGKQNPFSIMLSAGASAVIPQTASGVGLVIQEPVGHSETLLIFSIAPFTQTLATLEADKYPRTEQHQINKLLNPLEVAQALLQDLHNASGLGETIAPNDNYVLDVNAWASLNFVYQVS